MIGGYKLYRSGVGLVGTNCTDVRYDWWVLTVQMCGVIGGYKLYRSGVGLVGTNCTDVGMIGGY